MNFLAHCALAQRAGELWRCDESDTQGLLAGAIIGDFVKGPVNPQWPTALQAGVRLHRKIDAWSNLNPNIGASNALYPSQLRRLAPIFTDIIADYWLSQYWLDYHDMPRTHLSQNSYDAVDRYGDFLSANGRRFVSYMRSEDLLANYHQWRHVSRGFASVLRRLNRTELLAETEATSLAVLDDAGAAFQIYYPELNSALSSWNAFDAVANAAQ